MTADHAESIARHTNMQQYNQKIPIPPGMKWREVRVRIFPFLTFLLVAVVVAWFWRERVDAANMVGRVVGKQAEIRSPQPGSLADLAVTAFDNVEAGDVVGRLITTDPKIIEAELAMVLAQMELLRLSRDPFVDQQRNLLNYESMQVDLMENRARLGIARIRKEQARREFERLESMARRGLAAEEIVEQAETDYLTLMEEADVMEKLVSRLETRLENLNMEHIAELWNKEDPLMAAFQVHQRTIEKIEAEMMPVILKAPVSGMVAEVYKLNGEFVDQGEPILRIHSPQADYILAHVRHPLQIYPEPGMQVLVRKQGRRPQEAIMEIASVGVQMENIEEFTALFPNQPFETTGLPVRVAISHELNLMPGEVVDLRLLAR